MTVINPGAGGGGASVSDRTPGLVTPFDLGGEYSSQSVANGYIFASRVVIPKAGVLHDISIFVAGSSGGNVRAGIYDTGNASAGNRSLLWDSGTAACGANGAWQVVGDPALTVTSGQALDFTIQSSGGAAMACSVMGASNPGTAFNRLPASFLPVAGGAAPFRHWYFAQTFGAYPATIAEASLLLPTQQIVVIIGRVV